jgi:hypothetical protein
MTKKNPNKSKKMQAKKLGFVWSSLVEIGLFKGLQREKQKNPLQSQVVCQRFELAMIGSDRFHAPVVRPGPIGG